jgi:hypothetical protein
LCITHLFRSSQLWAPAKLQSTGDHWRRCGIVARFGVERNLRWWLTVEMLAAAEQSPRQVCSARQRLAAQKGHLNAVFHLEKSLYNDDLRKST